MKTFRDVFTTLLYNYDRNFRKNTLQLKAVKYFLKNLHYKYLIGS